MPGDQVTLLRSRGADSQGVELPDEEVAVAQVHACDAVGRGRHHPPDPSGRRRPGNEGARNREDALTRRALVTGGAGFIGSHVAEALLAAGYDVVVVDDLSHGKRSNVPPGRDFEHLDIRSPEAGDPRSRGPLRRACSCSPPRWTCASASRIPRPTPRSNIIGTLNLLEAARHAPHRPRVIFSSTGGAIYGDASTPPSPEESAKDPESPYGISKLSVEYYLAYYARTHGLDTVALRYANVYGPRQDPHGEAGVVAIFCQRLLDGRPLTVFGTGRQTRDYVFVTDVAARERDRRRPPSLPRRAAPRRPRVQHRHRASRRAC